MPHFTKAKGHLPRCRFTRDDLIEELEVLTEHMAHTPTIAELQARMHLPSPPRTLTGFDGGRKR